MGWRHEIYGDGEQAARRRSVRWVPLGALTRPSLLAAIGHSPREALDGPVDLVGLGAALTTFGIIDYQERARKQAEDARSEATVLDLPQPRQEPEIEMITDSEEAVSA